MLETAFMRGPGAAPAAYLAPGEDLTADGLAVRVIIASRDMEGESAFTTAPLKTRQSILQVRVRELADLGVDKPALNAVFRVAAPGHELDGALFEIDAEPMILDAPRKVWTCPVSPPDPEAAE